MLSILVRRCKRYVLRVLWTTLLLCSISVVAWSQVQPEIAQSADKFVDSIGVNTHLRYLDTAYKDYDTVIKPRLQELGVRHTRDSTIPADSTAQSKFIDLGKLGIKSTLIIDSSWNQTLDEVEKIVSMIPDSVEAIEGPNEWDVVRPIYGGQEFPTGLRDFQSQLYSTVKGTATTQNLPVLAPSMAQWSNAVEVGSIACDIGNMHSYSGDLMPTGGDLDSHQILSAQLICPEKPIIATETGWQNATGDPHSISEMASAKYIPRLLLEYFNRGIYRTFIYEFIDEMPEASNPERNFGLLHYDGSPKPAFTALKNLITLLNDPGVAFSPSSLDYTLQGNPQTIHHTLLQKRNGTFYLLLWQEVSSFDLEQRADISVPDQPITLTLNTPIQEARLYLPLNSTDSISQYSQPKQLQLTIPDHPLLLELVP